MRHVEHIYIYFTLFIDCIYTHVCTHKIIIFFLFLSGDSVDNISYLILAVWVQQFDPGWWGGPSCSSPLYKL